MYSESPALSSQAWYPLPACLGPGRSLVAGASGSARVWKRWCFWRNPSLVSFPPTFGSAVELVPLVGPPASGWSRWGVGKGDWCRTSGVFCDRGWPIYSASLVVSITFHDLAAPLGVWFLPLSFSRSLPDCRRAPVGSGVCGFPTLVVELTTVSGWHFLRLLFARVCVIISVISTQYMYVHPVLYWRC